VEETLMSLEAAPAGERRLRRWLSGAIVLLGVAGLVGVVLSRPSEPPLGALLAGFGFALVLGLVLWPSSPLSRVSVLFGTTGVVMLGLWLIGAHYDVILQPRVVFDAFIVVGAVLVGGAIAVLTRSPLGWLLGLVAAGALWVTSAIAGFGVLFDPLIPWRMAHVLVALGGLAAASWAGHVVFRAASTFGAPAITRSLRLGELTLSALLATFIGAYGIWYGYIVGPTDRPPTLEAALEASRMRSVPGYTRQAVTVTLENPGDTRLVIIADAYNVLAVDLVPAESGTMACRMTSALMERDEVACPESSPIASFMPIRFGTVGVPLSTRATYRLVQTGRLLRPGSWLDPGTTVPERSTVYLPDDVVSYLFEYVVMYGRQDRLAFGRPEDSDLESRCIDGYGVLMTYRRVPGDPIAGLINAIDPVRLQAGWQVDPDRGTSLGFCQYDGAAYTPFGTANTEVGESAMSNLEREMGFARIDIGEVYDAR
jgi:hypothetical protein